ncbi:MAG TPA: co-chaperone DjlA [Gammaproteobacteria bacterium]|jgi:DnaJ like chaperone protein|nr:co-chaperone DjlA [Chromatiales bacterium]MCP4926579.1 co-chaperone DjlA [Gammaproteobacteria bacterium]MDP7154166.1 co-chaperone DjlA [Gammaproteobacteria bacterium]MDP7296109.1 co-chaperone DjlA [Gammaproteobacteria bacterium]HJP38011.1 co-chaperone DjlA [Gammaproteobacteria bacterium]
MSWAGKLVGATLGYVVSGGNIIGIAIGALVGHQFDRGLSIGDRVGHSAGGGRFSAAERQAVFFETTFLVMGYVAKADGRVTEEEIQAARAVMHRMQLRPEAVRQAINLFTEGKQPETDIEPRVSRLRQACGRQPELIQAFLEIQLQIALSKGSITTEERTVLWRIADILGVGRVALAQLEALLRAQRSFGDGFTRQSHAQDLTAAYQALGIESTATDKEVKTAYRRLMNQHHPDKLVAKGLPDSMLEVAKERTREIRAAYEVIKEYRKIK